MTYRYKRRTNFQREQEMSKVKALLEQGKNGREISKETGIAYSTCCKYINKVTKREIEKREEIQGDPISLKDRALRIMTKYKEFAEVCRSIRIDPKKSSKDRLDAGKLEMACENNIYNMLKSGTIQGNIQIGNVPKLGEVSKIGDTSTELGDTDTKIKSKKKKRRHAFPK